MRKYPICEDCRWFLSGNACNAPQNRIPIKTSSLVRRVQEGRIGYRWFTCSTLRSFGLIVAPLYQACGKRGRWFEAADKQPLHSPLIY